MTHQSSVAPAAAASSAAASIATVINHGRFNMR
jgi:hypothetical protein